MTDGWWRIKQHAPNNPSGFMITEIMVGAENAAECFDNADRLKFVYRDGSEEYFPWASIVHAEYQPPTKD